VRRASALTMREDSLPACALRIQQQRKPANRSQTLFSLTGSGYIFFPHAPRWSNAPRLPFRRVILRFFGIIGTRLSHRKETIATSTSLALENRQAARAFFLHIRLAGKAAPSPFMPGLRHAGRLDGKSLPRVRRQPHVFHGGHEPLVFKIPSVGVSCYLPHPRRLRPDLRNQPPADHAHRRGTACIGQSAQHVDESWRHQSWSANPTWRFAAITCEPGPALEICYSQFPSLESPAHRIQYVVPRIRRTDCRGDLRFCEILFSLCCHRNRWVRPEFIPGRFQRRRFSRLGWLYRSLAGSYFST